MISILNEIKNFNNYIWINIFATVLFFLIVQTLFFLFIASKQYEVLLLKKTNFISQLGEYNITIRKYINSLKLNLDNLHEAAIRAKEERNKKNNYLIYKYCIKPIFITTLILLFIIINTIMTKNKKWSYIETISLILILGSYLTELYFFFFIVKKYDIIGDHEIFYKSLKSLSKNLQFKTITTNK
jgi:hypothetical protein